MLLEFSVKNFRSIRDEQTFTMLPSKSVKGNKNSLLNYDNLSLLSSAVIYGRNASGKSNLLNAISALQDMVVNSGRNKINLPIKQYEPFKLATESTKQPIEFKIEFIGKDDDRYLYELHITERAVLKENLYFYPKGQKAKLYERRQGFPISYGDYFTGRKKDIEESLYSNQLFLSKASTNKIDALIAPYLFFSECFSLKTTYSGTSDNTYLSKVANKLAESTNEKYSINLNKLIRFADTGIQAISMMKNDLSKMASRYNVTVEDLEGLLSDQKYEIITKHIVFNNSKIAGEISFNISEESIGTQKLLAIGGRIIDALMDGQVLIIDEFDTSLHPKLTKQLIAIFNSPLINKNNAQLIIATHDVSLLDRNLFRRDQIWIAEKEYEGNSHYYSVSDINGVRSEVPLEQWYMNGKLGGVPVFNELELDFDF